MYNYAVFGGSNGFWRTDTLQMIGMDPSMLTEDVDSSIRAMSYGFKIGYNHHLVSLEQPPPNFSALLKQRLRWSQGWYQVRPIHTCFVAPVPHKIFVGGGAILFRWV